MNDPEFEPTDFSGPPRRPPIFAALLLWIAISATAWWLAFTFDPESEPVIKSLHVLIFFLWSLATFNVLRRQSVWRLGSSGQLIICLLAAAASELAERWIPNDYPSSVGHYPDWLGFGCSSLGVFLAAFLRWRLDMRQRARAEIQNEYESAPREARDFDDFEAPPA